MSSNITKQSSASRYRGIIISIVLFLILITSILVTSIYNSLKIADLRLKTVTSTVMREQAYDITKDLMHLKVKTLENPSDASIQTLIGNLKKKVERYDDNLAAFENGGEIIGPSGANEYMESAKTSERLGFVNQTKTLWQPLRADLDAYFGAANNPELSLPALTKVSNAFATKNSALYDNMDKLSGSMVLENAGRAKFLRTVQSFGISFAILYFIIFMAYFVRKLRQSDRAADVAKQETTNILETVNSGLFLLDKDLNIGQQHSKELVSILKTSDLSGRKISDVLQGMVSSEDLENTEGFVEQLYNPRVNERLVNDLNPLQKVKVLIDDAGKKSTRHLDFNFSRVYDDKNINQILVNVNDVTQSVLLEERLEQERKQNDQQLQMISTILNSDNRLIRDYVHQSKARVETINGILRSPESNTSALREKLRAIFREVHSLKGESSAVEMGTITGMATDFEEDIKTLQKQDNISGDSFLGLIVHLDNIINMLDSVDKLSRRLEGADLGNKKSPVSLDDVPNTDSTESDMALNTTAPQERYYQNFVSKIGQRNHKKIALKLTGVELLNDNSKPQSALKEMAIQLLRNAAVHGIETPSTRLETHKPETGTIEMMVNETDSHYQLVVKDDGGGIDYDKIRKKAIESGMFDKTAVLGFNQNQLLNVLFSSGFSTLDAATEDAGQGVGLDIIKDRIKQLNGKIGVNSGRNQFTKFMITLPKA